MLQAASAQSPQVSPLFYQASVTSSSQICLPAGWCVNLGATRAPALLTRGHLAPALPPAAAVCQCQEPDPSARRHRRELSKPKFRQQMLAAPSVCWLHAPVLAASPLGDPLLSWFPLPFPCRIPQASGLADQVAEFNGTVFAPTNAAFVEHIKEMGVDINNLNDTTRQLVITVLVRPRLI